MKGLYLFKFHVHVKKAKKYDKLCLFSHRFIIGIGFKARLS